MRVVSLAVFRHVNSPYELPQAGIKQGRFYTDYLPAAIRTYRTIYPEWELRIHHDGTVLESDYGQTLQWLADAGIVKLVHMGPADKLCESMLWRMAPLDDPEVEYFVCRDIDSCPTPRERKAVDTWIDSGKIIHSINDSRSHTGLMGGMVGIKCAPFRAKMGGGIETFKPLWKTKGWDLNTHGDDQRFLNFFIKRRFRRDILWHTELPKAKGGLEDISPHIGASYCIQATLRYFENNPNAQTTQMQLIEDTAQVTEKIVLLGCNPNHDYSFLAPLTALLWKEVVGYKPLILFTGEREEWTKDPKLWHVLSACYQANAQCQHIGTVENHRDSTVAQICRLYGGDVIKNPNTWIITGDVDMWPLTKDWYQPKKPGLFHLWYANAYQGEKWPICYLGGLVSQWREIMGHREPGTRLCTRIQEQLDAGLGDDTDTWAAWNYDELLFGVRMKAWGGRTFGIDRHGGPPADRIDRCAWPKKVSVKGKVDAHLVRPGYADHWAKIRPILVQLLDPKWVAWADNYRNKYLELV
ncbi:hypothetical protein LCGC14_0669820 [marine sediment metagenome]|uniref:Uncharacterized protein n=1 Tax=marine sediment metagenome TaxID=412755 RepID=A0A0F9TZE9_9ZZZZ